MDLESEINFKQYVLHSAYYRSDSPKNKRRSRADAPIVPRDCGPTIIGPSLRWAEFTIYRIIY